MIRIAPPPEPIAPKPSAPARQRGIALIVVLWAAVMLALIAGSVVRLSRGDLNLTRNLVEATKAELAADSALWRAVHTIVNGGPQAWRTDGTVYAWRFDGAEVRVRVTDELGRIDINAAPHELLAALFVSAGAEPDAAAGLADAVVEFRDQRAEIREQNATQGPPALPFTLTDGLAQVEGMPPALLNRIAGGVTVYTGLAQPRPGVASPMVPAAIEGRQVEDGDTPEIPDVGVVGDQPTAIGETEEPAGRASALLRIEAEALSAGGSYFAREAVIALTRGKTQPYQTRLWRRGVRILFPVTQEEAQ
jgi:general secretion pathway protein K